MESFGSRYTYFETEGESNVPSKDRVRTLESLGEGIIVW